MTDEYEKVYKGEVTNTNVFMFRKDVEYKGKKYEQGKEYVADNPEEFRIFRRFYQEGVCTKR